MPATRRKLLYTLLALGLGLLVVEAVSRLVELAVAPAERSLPTPDPGNTQDFYTRYGSPEQRGLVDIAMLEDEARGWSLAPSQLVRDGDFVYRTNSLGLRGPELAPKRPDEIRLLTLGDSSVFGTAVGEAEIFSSVAAQALGASWRRPVTPVNGATPGHTSQQAVQTFRQLAPQVRPDWVVVATLWSDLYRNDGRAQPAAAQGLRGPLRLLASYRLLRRALAPWLRSRQVRWITSGQDLAAAHSLDARVPLPRYARNLASIAEQAQAMGARCALLVLPAPVDLDRAPPPETVLLYRQAMAQVASDGGLPLVDGPRWFRQHGADLDHFIDQVHPSSEGHALLGQALADALAPLGP